MHAADENLMWKKVAEVEKKPVMLRACEATMTKPGMYTRMPFL
jgi:hypothetical protein